MIPEFTHRATTLIEDSDTPFFLYFPLTSPHAPICTNREFEGMSEAGTRTFASETRLSE
jgi:arylsulfatase A